MRHLRSFPRRPAGRRRAASALVGAPLAAVLLGACGEEAPPPPEVVRPIKVFRIEGRTQGGIREYPGTVRAAQTAEMAFEVPGKIIEFVYKEGERVDEGAVLARLDARDYQAQHDAALADFENSRVNFERAQKLFEEGAMPAIERDRRRTRMMENEAKLRTAAKALEDTELVAPFAGTMARKQVKDFENVLAKQTVLTLTDDSHLELKLDVPERDLAGRMEGERIEPDSVTRRTGPEVVVSAIGDRRFPAEFTEIASTADEETRTFEVTVTFEKPQGISILPGMTAKLVVHIPDGAAARLGLRIPAAATAADADGKPFVWIVDPSTNAVRRRSIALGDMTGGDVFVTSGLAGGDVVAVSGVSQLREGMTVRPIEQP